MDDKQLTDSLPSDNEEANFLLSEFSSFDPRAPKSKKKSVVLTISAVLALLVYTFLIISFTIYQSDPYCKGGPRVVPNILQPVIKYSPQSYRDHDSPDDPWFGRPSVELDKNWRDLLQWSDIRVPEKEVERLGRVDQAVHFPDGGYFGMLTVHHDLHCLMRVHHHMYIDYYFPNITEEERELETRHTIHCLDVLRKAIMCQADTTILTMRWLDFTTLPSANWSTPRACVDWSLIDNWAQENWVDPRADGMMVHPKFGPVFVDGKNNESRIGVASRPH